MQTGGTRYIYQNELDKTCFQHDMVYGRYKSLVKKIESDKFLRGDGFKIASDPRHDGYERGLASIVYKLFDKISAGKGAIKIKSIPSQQLADKLHKPIIRKFRMRKVYSCFKFLLCVIDVFIKYA